MHGALVGLNTSQPGKKLLGEVLSMAVAFVFNDEIPRVATLVFFSRLVECMIPVFPGFKEYLLSSDHKSQVSSTVHRQYDKKKSNFGRFCALVIRTYTHFFNSLM